MLQTRSRTISFVPLAGDSMDYRIQRCMSFPHSYECEQLLELPGSISLVRHWFSDTPSAQGKDGLLVLVCPKGGESWLGTFAFGQISSNGLSGLFATPDPETICVVARGAGYLVKANRPDVWEILNVKPVVEAHAVPAQGLLIFA